MRRRRKRKKRKVSRYGNVISLADWSKTFRAGILLVYLFKVGTVYSYIISFVFSLQYRGHSTSLNSLSGPLESGDTTSSPH